MSYLVRIENMSDEGFGTKYVIPKLIKCECKEDAFRKYYSAIMECYKSEERFYIEIIKDDRQFFGIVSSYINPRLPLREHIPNNSKFYVAIGGTVKSGKEWLKTLTENELNSKVKEVSTCVHESADIYIAL